jgi:hypothetical protein
LAKILHLVIPGLLGPWAVEPGFPLPEAPALERLLGRARVTTLDATGSDATLFTLFGLPVSTGQDLPVAAITRLVDSGDTQEDWWLRADPVHLHPDLQQVLLFDARSLAVDPDEAAALTAEFNREFSATGLTLDAPRPSRWYLRLAADPGLHTCPLHEALGRNINTLLPKGKESGRWHALLTEIQMVFHNSPVNLAREGRGQRTINSVWFWGSGRLPHGAYSPCDGIYAADPLTRGLARLAGVALSPLPDHVADWRVAAEEETEALVVLEATRYDRADDNLYGWVGHVNALEVNWFAPCLALLKDKALEVLYLYPCNGQVYVITPRHQWRFWRRLKPLPDYVAEDLGRR